MALYTSAEVEKHSKINDLWVVIFDEVYDVTEFQAEHPGGVFVFRDYGGKDVSFGFNAAQHSTTACNLMKKYLIGRLRKNE